MRLEDDNVGQFSLDGSRQVGQGSDVHQLFVDDLQVIRGPVVRPDVVKRDCDMKKSVAGTTRRRTKDLTLAADQIKLLTTQTFNYQDLSFSFSLSF